MPLALPVSEVSEQIALPKPVAHTERKLKTDRSFTRIMSVYLLATLDTKGDEAALVRRQLVHLGIDVVLVDTGCLGRASVPADISREQVFSAAGTSLEEMTSGGDRGIART